MKRQRRRKLIIQAEKAAALERFNQWADPDHRAERAELQIQNELKSLEMGGGPSGVPRHRGGTYKHRFQFIDNVGVVARPEQAKRARIGNEQKG
jgi:hypothetical protein